MMVIFVGLPYVRPSSAITLHLALPGSCIMFIWLNGAAYRCNWIKIIQSGFPPHTTTHDMHVLDMFR